MPGGLAMPLSVELDARAELQDHPISAKVLKLRKVLEQEFGKWHGLDETKQDRDSLPVHFLRFWIFARIESAFGRHPGIGH
jgi:hypothetical protein